jgi:hypothetical protein
VYWCWERPQRNRHAAPRHPREVPSSRLPARRPRTRSFRKPSERARTRPSVMSKPCDLFLAVERRALLRRLVGQRRDRPHRPGHPVLREEHRRRGSSTGRASERASALLRGEHPRVAAPGTHLSPLRLSSSRARRVRRDLHAADAEVARQLLPFEGLVQVGGVLSMSEPRHDLGVVCAGTSARARGRWSSPCAGTAPRSNTTTSRHPSSVR